MSSSYMYAYQYVGSGTKNVVAATATWDEDRPVKFDQCVWIHFEQPMQYIGWSRPFTNPIIEINHWHRLLHVHAIELSGPANGASTPSISNLSIARHSNAPSEPGIEIDGKLDGLVPHRPVHCLGL